MWLLIRSYSFCCELMLIFFWFCCWIFTFAPMFFLVLFRCVLLLCFSISCCLFSLAVAFFEFAVLVVFFFFWFCCYVYEFVEVILVLLRFAVRFLFCYWLPGHHNMQIQANCLGTRNIDGETTPSRISAEIIHQLMDDFESSPRHQQSGFICDFSLHSLRIEIRPWLWEYPSVLADKALPRSNLFRSRPAVSICFPHAIEDGSTCCDNRTAYAPHVSLP